MKKLVMTKWVKALRSGKYKKGTGKLCLLETDGSKYYCCLGVLCAIAPENKGGSIMPQGGNLDDQQRIQTWSGIKSANGEFDNKIKELNCHVAYLTTLNDEADWSFEKIASFIERNYKKL